jgi:hypothetical protein
VLRKSHGLVTRELESPFQCSGPFYFPVLYSPFYAAMEIMTSRMLINLYGAHKRTVDFSLTGATVVQPMEFVSSEGEEFGHNEADTRF